MFGKKAVKNETQLVDHGPNPFTVNIEEVTVKNNTFRTALWTGKYLQVTLMTITPGGDIGLEVHKDTDQFLRLEEGKGYVVMGSSKNNLNYKMPVKRDHAFIIPAGIWHNFVNTGKKPAKLYSIYAPSHHPFGTVHKTRKEADEAEEAEKQAELAAKKKAKKKSAAK